MNFQEAKELLINRGITQNECMTRIKLTDQLAFFLGFVEDEHGDATVVVRVLGGEKLYMYHPSQLDKADF